MSDQPIRPYSLRLLIYTALLIGTILLPPAVKGEEVHTDTSPPLPLLVRARHTDTPATMAQRFFNDPTKGWMITEYNGKEAFAGGEAVVVPTAPFRPGGLAPDSYQTVPVLAYSDIGDSAEQVSPSAFYDQMRWLKTEGFVAITPNQLVEFMKFSGQLPRRSVLITFDTVSQNLYTTGIPILQELEFTATVFISTDAVGRRDAMTWNQIRQSHRDGFAIGCQGRSGRSLTRRTSGQPFKTYFESVASELRSARHTIETHLDEPCLFLAYPHGDTNSLVSAMAAKLGFAAAFARRAGENAFFADRYGIHRTPIDSRINAEQFATLITTRIPADLN
ncbi:polysaccharide deacetylase family protein [Desulfosarcina sp.]|uniref:polysaccharide deacetylase family protein n=1 Tax=Desulfosarcina sp. TaxID=2027861 RepID=UPI0035650192